MGQSCSGDYDRALEKRRRLKLARLDAELQPQPHADPGDSRSALNVNPAPREGRPQQQQRHTDLSERPPPAPRPDGQWWHQQRSASPRLEFRPASPGKQFSRPSSAGSFRPPYPAADPDYYSQQRHPHALASRSAASRVLPPQIVQIINMILSDEIQTRTEVLQVEDCAWRHIITLATEMLPNEALRRAITALVALEAGSRRSIITGEVKHRSMIVSFYEHDHLEAKLSDMVSAHCDRSFSVASATPNQLNTPQSTTFDRPRVQSVLRTTAFGGSRAGSPTREPPAMQGGLVDYRYAGSAGEARRSLTGGATFSVPSLTPRRAAPRAPTTTTTTAAAPSHHLTPEEERHWSEQRLAPAEMRLSAAQAKLFDDRVRHLAAQETAARNSVMYEEAIRRNSLSSFSPQQRRGALFMREDALQTKMARQKALLEESRRMYVSAAPAAAGGVLFHPRDADGRVHSPSREHSRTSALPDDETSLRDASAMALQQRLHALSAIR